MVNNFTHHLTTKTGLFSCRFGGISNYTAFLVENTNIVIK